MSSESRKTTLKGAGGEVFDPPRPRIEFLTALSDADDEYCLLKGTLPPGAVVPIHSHAERETFYVVDGQVEGLLDDRWHMLGPNDTFDVPGGRKHAWRNLSDAPAVMAVVVPMRLARFLRDMDLPAPVAEGAPGPSGTPHFLALVQAYGYWIGSPADNAAVGITLG